MRWATLEPWSCLIVAFAVRCLSWFELTRGPIDRLLTIDCYGHLQRIAATVREFPRIPSFDAFLGAPDGAVWIWPPGFDFTLAAVARAFLGEEATLESIAGLVSWAPPLLGAAAVMLLRLWVSELHDPDTGRRAAWAFAVLPAATTWSAFGHLDQHAAEVVAALAVAWSAQRAVARRDGDVATIAALAFGLAAACLVWQGAIFLGVVLVAIAWLASRPRTVGAALLLSAAAVVPFAAAADGPFTYVSFSLFQPVFLCGCAVAAGLAAFGRIGVALSAVFVAVAVAGLPVLREAVLHFLAHGDGGTGGEMREGGYLAYPAAWLSLIGEYRPLYTLGVRAVLERLSIAVLVVPWVLVGWALALRRGAASVASGVGSRRLAVPLVLGACFTAMAVLQHRYVYYLAPLVALAPAEAWPRLRSFGVRRWWAPFLISVFAFSCLAGNLRLLRPEGPPSGDLLWTLERLRLLDPPPLDPLRRSQVGPGQIESVMAPWAVGHLVTAIAGRPAVADNFGYGFIAQARFWSTPTAEDAALGEWMRQQRIGYVLVGNLESILPLYARTVGRADDPEALGRRLFAAREARPVDFLERVLESRSGNLGPDGVFRPQFRVFRRVDP